MTNKIIWKHLILSEIIFKLSCSKKVFLFLNLFVVSTVNVLGSEPLLNVQNQSAQEDLPALQRKVKKGLIRIQNRLIYGERPRQHTGALVFDDLYAYLTTPNGLFRTLKPITANSSFELIGFQGKVINNLYVHNNALYVLKYSQETPSTKATDHSFLKSEDRGKTFIPMDGGLEYCLGGYCSFLTPDEAIFKDNLIFLNAGGAPNLQVSNNQGASWIPLLGRLEAMACYQQVFEIINNRVLVGGECPLDIAYIRAGTLRSDFLGWTSTPTAVITPNLQNRNVQFIKQKPNSSDVYAGVEGGLLKSNDLGQSFRFVVKYSNLTRNYPYIQKILFHSKDPNVIVIGGFDKAALQVFLAYSKDNGETWIDLSDQTQLLTGAPNRAEEVDSVHFISEDPEGNVLVGVTHPKTRSLAILQLRVNYAMFR